MKRKEYLDYLRLLATFFVFLVHVSVTNFGAYYFDKNIWRVFNIYDVSGRWTLPVFVMISGALFLGREVDIKKLYSKNILRMVVAFLVWNFIYYLFAGDSPLSQLQGLVGNTKSAHLAELIRCHYHLWYLFMVIGIYMCIPILKAISDNEKARNCYMVLGFIFTCLLPVLFSLAQDFGNDNIKLIVESIKWDYDQALFFLPLGYMFYFVFGYYVANKEIKKAYRIVIYVMGILGLVVTALLEKAIVFKTDDLVLTYYDCLSVQVFFTALAAFVLFKHIPFKNGKFYKVVRKASGLSFGAYLVHALIIEQLSIRLGINTLTILAPATPLKVAFSTPLVALIVFATSMFISFLLSLIPKVNKYIV